MILVTGGLGMIGAQTARALVELGHEVIVTTHHRAEVPTFLDGLVVVEAVDVTDRRQFLSVADRHRVTGIVHLAGSVPGADPSEFFRHDTLGLINAIEAARAWRVRRCAVASSLGVYGARPEAAWHEELPLSSSTLPHPIVALKKSLEPLVLHGLLGVGVAPVVLRIGTIWGPLMDPESPFNPVPPFISAALRGEQPAMSGIASGSDWCYAPDAGRAIALLMTTDHLSHDIYNVSSGRPFDVDVFVTAVRARFPDLVLSAGPDPRRGSDVQHHLDTTRLTQDTGFAPAFDIPAAVDDYVAWRTEHSR